MNRIVVLLLASLATSAAVTTVSAALAKTSDETAHASELTTQRHVQGIITRIEPSALEISGASRTEVIGRIDPKRTRVTVNGRPASLSSLEVTFHARGDIGLDDVWCTIDATTR